MAFDPHAEDFQRLGLRYARTLDASDPFGAARAFSAFGRRFAQNRDALPQSDGDRAFHLVARATDLIDYQLPFAADEGCQSLIDEARHLLGEALELDPKCHDATRMLAAAEMPSFEEYYRFLVDGEDEVRISCEQEADKLDVEDPEGMRLARELVMRPYARWLATEASRALICGRYRRCVKTSLQLLEHDPDDNADVRFTLALAYAKLEDEKALEDLVARERRDHGSPDTAWFALARLAMAHKRCDTAAARNIVQGILRNYPHAGLTLDRQDELPDGVYARLAVEPFSEDELILAVSEAAVLLQEGRDAHDQGSLGAWLVHQPEVAKASRRDRAEIPGAQEGDRS